MSTKPQIELLYDTYRSMDVVCYRFDYDEFLSQKVRLLPNVRWSQTKGCWIQVRKDFNLNLTYEHLRPFAFINYEGLKAKQIGREKEPAKARPDYSHRKTTEIPVEYMDMLLQDQKSENTIRNYTAYFKDFCFVFKDHELIDITKDDINSFIVKLIKKYNISESQQNQRTNAIKYYYERVLGRPKEIYDIDRPRKKDALPDVLSKEEVGLMLKIKNIKHKCIIGLLYSCGLRRSELVNLRIEDINSDRMMLKVVEGKGKKDRYVNLSDSLLSLINDYRDKYKPKHYLFEGPFEKQYSAESVVNVVKSSARKSGITRRVYPHILRHSFATHHIEQGTDIRYIQTWLGHESSKTTEIYTHVSETTFNKFKNPIDDFDIT